MSNKSRQFYKSNKSAPEGPKASPGPRAENQQGRKILKIIGTFMLLTGFIGWLSLQTQTGKKLWNDWREGEISESELDKAYKLFNQQYPSRYQIYLLDVSASTHVVNDRLSEFLMREIRDDRFLPKIYDQVKGQNFTLGDALVSYLIKKLSKDFSNDYQTKFLVGTFAEELEIISDQVNGIDNVTIVSKSSGSKELVTKIRKLVSTESGYSTNYRNLFAGIEQLIVNINDKERRLTQREPYVTINIVSDFFDDCLPGNSSGILDEIKSLCSQRFHGELNLIKIPLNEEIALVEANRCTGLASGASPRQWVEGLLNQIRQSRAFCKMVNVFDVEENLSSPTYDLDRLEQPFEHCKLARIETINVPTINANDFLSSDKLSFTNVNKQIAIYSVDMEKEGRFDPRYNSYLLRIEPNGNNSNLGIGLTNSSEPRQFYAGDVIYSKTETTERLYLFNNKHAMLNSGDCLILFQHASNRKFLIPLDVK